MLLLAHPGAKAFDDPIPPDDQELCTRVHAEFLEMPGLRVTLPQACRLFSIEPERCERLLGGLVRAGHLSTDGRTFGSSRDGRRSA